MRKLLLLSVVLLMIIGCCQKSKEKKLDWSKYKVTSLEKYVYIDLAGVLHTKNGCKAVYKDHNMQSVEPILVNSINRNQLDKICSQCVQENQIDSLMNITNSDNANLRDLYQTLINEGYTPPEYQQFKNDMKDENNLREIYKTLKKEGYEPPVFEEFKEDMGL